MEYVIKEALTAPLHAGEIAGIPIGIFQIVLIIGLVIYKWHVPIHKAIRKLTDMLSVRVLAFILIVALG
jgi:predicted cation transporter